MWNAKASSDIYAPCQVYHHHYFHWANSFRKLHGFVELKDCAPLCACEWTDIGGLLITVNSHVFFVLQGFSQRIFVNFIANITRVSYTH